MDRACRQCGRTIYFNYRGPIDGICGRCTDRALAKRKGRTRTRTVMVEGRGRGGLTWFVVVLVFLAGIAAAVLFRSYLPF